MAVLIVLCFGVEFLCCLSLITPYIRLVKFQLVCQIPDVYVSACVLAGKLILLFFSCFIIL